ncbi:hypothetical protein [Stutzerimonas zhaodongensis]|uniref:hypothetical protein n=1 Tax=Stutzerimonas TaxID=2901164 RepID=UPI00388EF4B4
MGNERDDSSYQNNDASRAERAGKDDLVIPGSPPPLGSERTDVSPGHEAGVDELPNNDGSTPRSRSHARGDEVMSGVPDIDPDSAELDDAPNPR